MLTLLCLVTSQLPCGFFSNTALQNESSAAVGGNCNSNCVEVQSIYNLSL